VGLLASLIEIPFHRHLPNRREAGRAIRDPCAKAAPSSQPRIAILDLASFETPRIAGGPVYISMMYDVTGYGDF
jgi:hypothetical protein